MEESKEKTGGDFNLHKKKRNGLNELQQNRIEHGKRDRKIKTTYFFGPVNKLTGKEGKEKIQHGHSEVLGEVEEKSVTMESAVQVKTPVKDNAYDKLIQELQSSDDSFDGVRWKSTPNKVGNSKSILHSSPLKGAGPVLAKNQGRARVAEALENFGNDPSISVLDKYGLGIPGVIGSTPVMSRSVSDSTSSESKHKKDNSSHYQVSPSLSKSRSNMRSDFSTGFKRPKLFSSASGDLGNVLNSWIDKFDQKKPNPSSTSAPISEVMNYNVPSDENNPAKLKCLEIDLESVHFNEDFSDSSLNNSPTELKSAEDKSNNENQYEDADNNSDDPFSDDDDDILRVISTQSQGVILKNESCKKTIDITKLKDTSFESETNKDLDDSQFSDDVFSDDDSIVNAITAFGDTSNSRNKQENDLKRAKTGSLSKNLGDETINDAKISFNRDNLIRYSVSSILKNSYTINGKKRSQLIMEVKDKDEKTFRLVVRGEYIDLDYQTNDIIHVIITDPSHPKLIDDSKNILIWNPDILVSATTVSQQLLCPRKTVLTSRFKFPGEPTPALLVGIMIHSVFQSCFVSENWSVDFMKDVMESEIQKELLNIYCMGDEVESIRNQMLEQLPFLEEWFKRYYKKPLSNNSFIPTNRYNHSVLFSANQALDIEENIWSPMFGIKGMIDVTIEANLRDKSHNGNYLLPMEIKTGREHISHQAQSSLYSLLFKDRYDLDVVSFLLVYTKEKITKKYDISPTDLKSLVNLRNRITKYLKENTRELPKVLKQSQCERCEIQQSCMTIFKLVESGTAEASGLDENVFNELTSHLNNEHYVKFYNYWENLITREESVMMALKKNLWKFSAHERELIDGKAIGNLQIKDSNDEHDLQEEFLYTFERKKDDTVFNFQSSQLSKYDKVIISDEQGNFAISQGFVISISSRSIKISTRRRLITRDLKLKSLDGRGYQGFNSVLYKSQSDGTSGMKTFRVDKDDMFHGLGLARYNLLSLFLVNGDSKSRSIVVDLNEPKFSHTPILKGLKVGNFNKDQVKAIKAAMTCEDYCLLLGMPGTGKTTVIAALIDLIVKNNKTVLLASYTHSAVDNILLKVKKLGIEVLRVGSRSKVHKDLVSSVADSKRIESYTDFCEVYLRPKVVASTCLGINDVTFNMRSHFDYCIIDEASQVSMPISLGPLRFCDKFILVGDHYQLPPLVQHQNPEVKRGLSKSLFKSLAEAHPNSVTELCHQYRMCEDIMFLSNAMIYGDRLKCGSAEVANAHLHIPDPSKIKSFVRGDFKLGTTWMETILLPKNKVIFMNHDSLPALERKFGDKVDNPIEAELIRQIVEGLLESGVSEKSIGVMSLYRSQVRLLSRLLLNHPDIEVMTADQFQGKDKECIIISFVRSNKEQNPGDLVKEWSRVNVAITRSKTKLVMLGSRSTLSNAATINKFVNILDKKHWIYDFPQNADKIYDFPLLHSSQNAGRASQELPKIVEKHPIIRDIVNANK